MSWFALATLSMLAKSAQNFAEKSSQKKIGSFLTLFLLVTLSTIIIFPYVFLTNPLPSVNLFFWIAVVGSVLIYIFAKPMRLFAIGTGDISEIIPLISFKSLFSLIYGWILLEEIPTNWGLLGVTLISLGGYYMNFDINQVGTINRVLHPFKKVVRSKTQSFLFLSLLIAPISSILDKIAINNTYPRSPHYTFLAENLLSILMLIPILTIRKVNIKPLKNITGWKTPFILSIIYSVSNLLAFSAISIGYVGYVAAILQLSSLIAVFGGYYFLKEGGFRKRFISAIIMGIGAFLVGYLG